jgi:transposase-like protein
MSESEGPATYHCERCDRETTRVTKRLNADGSTSYVCWSCQYREEKRINLKETWRRQGRGARAGR